MNIKINWSLITPKTAVCCKTGAEAKVFLEKAKEHGIRWYNGDAITDDTNWGIYQKNTCYTLEGNGIRFGSSGCYASEDFTILLFVELVGGDMTDAEAAVIITSSNEMLATRMSQLADAANYLDNERGREEAYQTMEYCQREYNACLLAISALQARHDVVSRPLDEWTEDDGDVLWWSFPIEEAPYCGSPLDSNFPSYVTHWTRFTCPEM